MTLLRAASRILVLAINLVATVTPAAAYFDNFENGSLDGWLYATSGGISGDGVERHNSSMMAFAYNIGNGTPYEKNSNSSSLSQAFSYRATDTLAFDMHPTANAGGGSAPAGSGVSISFLNEFNVPLATEGFVYYTDPALVPPGYYQISPIQQSWSAELSDYAALAGLNSDASIAKVSLTFYAWAAFSGGGNIYPDQIGSSKVWFDNILVGGVPEPPIYYMMFPGILVLLAIRRRKGSGTGSLTNPPNLSMAI